jgi:hypothetical protein
LVGPGHVVAASAQPSDIESGSRKLIESLIPFDLALFNAPVPASPHARIGAGICSLNKSEAMLAVNMGK